MILVVVSFWQPRLGVSITGAGEAARAKRVSGDGQGAWDPPKAHDQVSFVSLVQRMFVFSLIGTLGRSECLAGAEVVFRCRGCTCTSSERSHPSGVEGSWESTERGPTGVHLLCGPKSELHLCQYVPTSSTFSTSF